LRPLRIGMLAPPMLPIPPLGYAGTERVVAHLIDGLTARGHRVTLFAPGDSTVDCEVVPTIATSLWSTDYRGPVDTYIQLSIARAWEQHERFDLIHSHVETGGFLFARHCPTPVLATLHGRLDVDGTSELMNEFTDIPLVAISESQRRFLPASNWVATIHHGLDLKAAPWRREPGDYLVFVGRTSPEKGIGEAIELARRTRLTLKIAAKVYDVVEQVEFDKYVQPAIEAGVAEYMGELPPASRDPLLAGALATVMLGAWPEPFGLVAIESLATGTPVIARRAGALTETIEHGVDGFLVDDVSEAKLAVEMVPQLDRSLIRQRALERFSRERMVDEYESCYSELISGRKSNDDATGGPVVRQLDPVAGLSGV